jgi:hypothetical protein
MGEGFMSETFILGNLSFEAGLEKECPYKDIIRTQ